jgi:hypothetical protein
MTQPVPRIFATSAGRTPAQKQRAIWGTLFIFYLMVGALFLHIFADRFVFHYAEVYTRISLWSLLLFTPFVLYRMKRTRSFAENLAKKYPTTWIRSWVMMPLTAAMLVGVFFAAPLGWLFAAAAWYGGPVHHVNTTAAKVGTYAQRKGCDQSATLRLVSVDKETCLDNLYSPSTMREGQLLNIGTTVFPFGFLIVSIESADPALTAGPQVNSTDAN